MFIGVDENNGLLVVMSPILNQEANIDEDLITWAGVVIAIAEVAGLLKVSSVARGCFVPGGEADAVYT